LIGKPVRVYTLHHPSDVDVLKDHPVLIKEGFNWPAAFYTSLCALWGGTWLAALLIFVAAVGLQLALELAGAERPVQLVAGIGLSAIVGFCANDWRRAKLHRRGYCFQGVVAAPDMGSARRRWFGPQPAS
jgi:hypothetical protein